MEEVTAEDEGRARISGEDLFTLEVVDLLRHALLVDASMTDGVAGLGIMLHAKQHLSGQGVGPGTDELAGDRVCYRTWRCGDCR